jgi:O-antigen/teichoic acid export membrane protein
MLGTAIRWCVMITLPVAVGGTLLAGRMIPLVYGPQYTGAIDLFRIMIWFFFFTVLHTIYSSGMIASGAERRYSQVMIVGTITYAVTTITGIGAFGLPGAAAALVASEGVTMLLMRNRLKETLPIQTRVPLARLLIAVGLMATAVNLLSHQPLVLIVAAGAVIYTAVLMASRAVTAAEARELLKRII